MDYPFKTTDVGREIDLSVPQLAKGKLGIGGSGGHVFGLTEIVGDVTGPEQELNLPDIYTLGPGKYKLKAKTLPTDVAVSFNAS